MEAMTTTTPTTTAPSVVFHPTTGFDGTFSVAGRDGLSHGQAWHLLRDAGMTGAGADQALAAARRR